MYQPTTKSATQETIDRLRYRVLEDEDLEVTGMGERDLDGIPLSQADSNFRSEIDFTGYKDIAEYDNGAYNFNVDQKPRSSKALNFEDRVDDVGSIDESIVDPQENAARESDDEE